MRDFENEEEFIYAYFRNGVMFVTPSVGLAWKRCTHGEPEIIHTSDDK
jgi:hypothetical protein